MRVLITGGNGQVGSTTASLLLARGDEVLSIDDFSTGRRDNLEPQPRLTQAEGSITDQALVDRSFADFRPEVVIHTAASYKDPDDWATDALVNAMGTAIIAKASKTYGVRRIVYFQTALCYGIKPLHQPIRLDHPLDPANSSYAISKTAGENYVQFSGVDWVTFRLANVMGPRTVSGPLPIFYGRLSKGQKCFVTPARRDFCFAGDLANVVVRTVDGAGRGTYHFSSGRDVAIKELYDTVVAGMKLNHYPEPEMRPLAPDDAPSILLDPERLFADFGQVAFTPIDEIIRVSIDHWQRTGVVGGYTHLSEARKPVRT